MKPAVYDVAQATDGDEEGGGGAARCAEFATDSCAAWLLNLLCAVLCIAGAVYGTALAISLLPYPDMSGDQPPLMGEYNRADLASIRYLLLEGRLWWPPPPPAAPSPPYQPPSVVAGL